MMCRDYLYDLLDEDALLIPGADKAICGVTPGGLPIYHYNLLVEHFMDEWDSDYQDKEELHVQAIEWVEYNICQNPEAPLIMYEIIDE
jgi:hypothetical protein